MLKKEVKWTEDDVKQYRALRSVLSQGDFNLKGNAVMSVAQLFQWFDSLDAKIQVAIGLQIKESAPKIEPMNMKPKAKK